MTAEDFQKWVRTQMEQTGASYAAARLAVLTQFQLCSRCLLKLAPEKWGMLPEGCADVPVHLSCIHDDEIVSTIFPEAASKTKP